jgi:hypothetical protein
MLTSLPSFQVRSADLEKFRRRLEEKLRAVLADRDLVIAHNVMTMPFNPA